jgi:hypothetical protein
LERLEAREVMEVGVSAPVQGRAVAKKRMGGGKAGYIRTVTVRS